MCDSSQELFHTACRHEIAGIVTEVGSKAAQHFKVGDRAGVGCFVRACRVSSCKLTTASCLPSNIFLLSIALRRPVMCLQGCTEMVSTS